LHSGLSTCGVESHITTLRPINNKKGTRLKPDSLEYYDGAEGGLESPRVSPPHPLILPTPSILVNLGSSPLPPQESPSNKTRILPGHPLVNNLKVRLAQVRVSLQLVVGYSAAIAMQLRTYHIFPTGCGESCPVFLISSGCRMKRYGSQASYPTLMFSQSMGRLDGSSGDPLK